MKEVDTYKEVKKLKFPNMTVNVFIPDITQEEQQRRMREIHKAAARLLLSAQPK